MMSEEEIELRDLVAQTLENNGLLAKIRAELRASVFLALEDQESVMEPPQLTNSALKTFLNTNEGSLVACLVREFLEFFQLDFTLSVFDPETAQGRYYNYGGRSKLMNDLHIENLNGKKGPLLAHILHIALGQDADSSIINKDGSRPCNNKNTTRNSTVGNQTAQSSALIDNNTQNNMFGEKIQTSQNVNLLKNEISGVKVSSINPSVEGKLFCSTVDGPKQLVDLTNAMRLKDIPLPLSTEEISPRSVTLSEGDHSSISSKEASKGKTRSLEVTPRNSPTIEQSLSQSKHESQAPPSSESVQKSSSKTDSQKKRPQQVNKSNMEFAPKTASSTLSSLSNLPPLMGVSFPTKQPATLPGISQSKDMHQIKAMIDLGLESQDNYDEDFNSSASASAKEDPTNQGTDTEIEEELGSGVDDILSSASALDDLTADATLSNLSGIADYLEDIK